MESQLKLGTSKINITPEEPVQLAGFAVRNNTLFEGIDDPIYARIFYFEQPSLSELPHKALIVTADILFWASERMDILRKEIANRFNINENAIILHATHNHSGPATTENVIDIGNPAPNYVKFLENKLVEGIKKAVSSVEDVFVEVGKGTCTIGINRRKLVNGKYIISENENGPNDNELNVIRFCSKSEKTKALLINYTCHPTTTNRNYLSPEFCGVATELIEQSYDGDVIAGYLQGCCGDINPISLNGSDGLASINILGQKLADAVANVLNSPLKRLATSLLKVEQTHVDLKFQSVPTVEELTTIAVESKSSTHQKWARRLLNDPQRLQPTTPLELTKLTLANDLILLAMNAEMVVEYGLFIKREFSGNVIPIGYSNGIIGYVTTRKQLEEGGYEPVDSSIYFGLPSPYDSSNEKKIKNHIISFINNN